MWSSECESGIERCNSSGRHGCLGLCVLAFGQSHPQSMEVVRVLISVVTSRECDSIGYTWLVVWPSCGLGRVG